MEYFAFDRGVSNRVKLAYKILNLEIYRDLQRFSDLLIFTDLSRFIQIYKDLLCRFIKIFKSFVDIILYASLVEPFATGIFAAIKIKLSNQKANLH